MIPSEVFRHAAHKVSTAVGSPWAFLLAVSTVAVWAITGPLFGYSDSWQLVINTGTTVVTFLMVFLIQNTQNREGRMMHLKLDELLRAIKAARTGFVTMDEMSDAELARLEREFHELRATVGNLRKSRTQKS